MVKINNNHILALLAAALAVACFMSLYVPIRFGRQQEARERTVKERLIKIRSAQERYRKTHGTYAADLLLLVRSGLLADSLQYIPYSDGKKFTLETTVQTARSGRAVPLMECGAGYNDYLSGLDKNAIDELTERANNAGRYPGMKIGDIKTPNNNAGNWE